MSGKHLTHQMIEAVSVPEPARIDFTQLIEPRFIVYVLMHNETPFYVGQSRCGLTRAIESHRDHIVRQGATLRCTHVLVYPCEDQNHMNALEAKLMFQLKPPYNRQIKRGWSVNGYKPVGIAR
jgi:hypothetical protein